MSPPKWLVLTLLFCALPIVCSHADTPSKGAQVSAQASFLCKWWSEDQMNGLDPNKPPPQNTEIPIQKWEYSDPVGTPHPDVVDFVVEIRNESDAAVTALSVEIEGQWKVGPFAKETLAKWGAAVKLKSVEASSVASHQVEKVRVPINVAAKMAELKNSRGWPYAFRGKAAVIKDGSTVATAERELTILKSD
jgi:hypothetical protein